MLEASSVVFPDTYRDSVFLMKISSAALKLDGIEAVSAMMATPRNKELFKASGLMTPLIREARQDDLAVGLRGRADALPAALEEVKRMLAEAGRPGEEAEALRPKTVIEAKKADPGLTMALISAPGEYAAYEAQKALDQGLDVMLYSDNVSLEDELRLKTMAAQKGLLLMGPDCGTALINGAPLGFANRVAPGGVGVVAASGTGAQEVMSLVDRFGGGISHCLGVGGRDLKDEIGGLSSLRALELLGDDPATEVIVFVGKPPGPKTKARLQEVCARLNKPVVVHFPGVGAQPEPGANMIPARSLEEAAVEAHALLEGPAGREACLALLDREEGFSAGSGLPAPGAGRRWLRGVYGGGTLCLEALAIAGRVLPGKLWSNLRCDGVSKLPDAKTSREHAFVDLGDDEFSVGRPHPMIDPAARLERLYAELTDPEVAVVLLDVVIGHGASPDQAAGIVETMERARRESGADGPGAVVVASVCGTGGDNPSREAVVATLARAGVLVFPSNARAATAAAAIVKEIA